MRRRLRAWRLQLRFRLNRLWHVRVRPSPLQREFNRGDPNGIVRAEAERIISEITREDTERGQ